MASLIPDYLRRVLQPREHLEHLGAGRVKISERAAQSLRRASKLLLWAKRVFVAWTILFTAGARHYRRWLSLRGHGQQRLPLHRVLWDLAGFDTGNDSCLRSQVDSRAEVLVIRDILPGGVAERDQKLDPVTVVQLGGPRSDAVFAEMLAGGLQTN